jgi:hypothetical protein
VAAIRLSFLIRFRINGVYRVFIDTINVDVAQKTTRRVLGSVLSIRAWSWSGSDTTRDKIPYVTATTMRVACCSKIMNRTACVWAYIVREEASRNNASNVDTIRIEIATNVVVANGISDGLTALRGAESWIGDLLIVQEAARRGGIARSYNATAESWMDVLLIVREVARRGGVVRGCNTTAESWMDVLLIFREVARSGGISNGGTEGTGRRSCCKIAGVIDIPSKTIGMIVARTSTERLGHSGTDRHTRGGRGHVLGWRQSTWGIDNQRNSHFLSRHGWLVNIGGVLNFGSAIGSSGGTSAWAGLFESETRRIGIYVVRHLELGHISWLL